MSPITIFWHRRDLRLHDNAGLYRALRSGHKVLCLFIFDKNILDELDQKDARVTFIHRRINALSAELQQYGSSLLVKYGHPLTVWTELCKAMDIAEVYINRDYEPYALTRDEAVYKLLATMNIGVYDFKDQVIFDKEEVVKKDGTPYTVFTPYYRAWLKRLGSRLQEGEANSYYLQSFPTGRYLNRLLPLSHQPIPELAAMGFQPGNIEIPPPTIDTGLITSYDKTRDYPALHGTSRLGIHLRFGTVSIRELVQLAQRLNPTFLKELVWREFYSQILAHFPKVVTESFRSKYDFITWRNDEDEFESWCTGNTGYPIVDAGMRQLNITGYMHNRVRMITASFLTKHLLIDWRWGEAYFAKKLLDYELASNNGGWQWAAGSGTDAAPYFRIFNPVAQQEKYDKDLIYIRKWISEYDTAKYPEPIVDHRFARERCLKTYKAGLAKADLSL